MILKNGSKTNSLIISNKPLLKTTLLLSSMMTMMAGAVVAPSLPQLTEHFKDIPNYELLTRLIITLPALFMAIFSPLVGFLTDKYGRLKLLIFFYVLYALSGVSGYFLSDLYHILIGRAFLGVAVAGIMTITVTLVGDYLHGDERNSFMGLQGAFMGIGGVVFINLAGLMADHHWQDPFLIYLFSILVIVFAFLFLYEPDRSEFLDKRSDLKTEPLPIPKLKIALVLIIIFLSMIFFYMIPVQLPYLMKQKLDISNAGVGLSISIYTFTGALVAMNLKRLKKLFSFPVLFFFAFFFVGIGYSIISFAGSRLVFSLGLFVAGLGGGIMMPSGNLWIMQLAPPSFRGRIMGMSSTAMFLGMFFSPIIIQPFIKEHGLDSSFLLIAISMVLISFFIPLLKRVK